MSLCHEEVFRQVYHTWCDQLQRFLISRGVKADDSIDLMQESFIRLWHICKNVQIEKAGSFLFTTSSRLIIDQYRKKKSNEKYKLSLRQKVDFKDGQYLVEEREFKERLEVAISSMTEANREVFMLHRFNDLKYKDIAERLEISVKAVEKRMHKALLHLRKQKILNK